MVRKLRVEYPGAIYHVMNRGDHREPIFQDDDERREFLRTLAETCVDCDTAALGRTRALDTLALLGGARY